MRSTLAGIILSSGLLAGAAELESRQLTHYVPQDLLEAAVRKDTWTEIPLNVKGGTRKGDVVRIWAGGLIDRGNGDQPGEHAASPCGPEANRSGSDPAKLALSPVPAHAFALLFKTDDSDLRKPLPEGKPLEIALAKDKERLWVGFNDERGRFQDNHLGRGRRHEFDPLWVRVEVIRIIVD